MIHASLGGKPIVGGLAREEAVEILAFHDDDALEALRTLIAERDAVEERLAAATLAIEKLTSSDPCRHSPA